MAIQMQNVITRSEFLTKTREEKLKNSIIYATNWHSHMPGTVKGTGDIMTIKGDSVHVLKEFLTL